MALLEHKYKFSVDNPKRGKFVDEQKFFRWTNKNFYRTSYNDMRSPVSVKIAKFTLGTCEKQEYGCTRIPRLHARSRSKQQVR
jgi:hypothetical protein